MSYFDERLKELHRQKLQKKHFEAMKEELRKQEEEVAKKAAELEAIKKKEQLDVDKLEGRSIKALFFTLAGSIEEKLSKERQEAYVAAMKYEAVQRDLQNIRNDLEACEDELEKLAECETEYSRLLEEKKESIKKEESHRASELIALEKEIEDISHEIIELEEALQAGSHALATIESIIEELKEAHSLAEWDTFMDSMLIDIQKHEHIHNAQDLVQGLRDQLRRFKTELADVNINGDIHIEMDDFSAFADWFFDNIFMDWDIKVKIENSQIQADETREQISATIDLLKNMNDARKNRRIKLEEELESIVVGE